MPRGSEGVRACPATGQTGRLGSGRQPVGASPTARAVQGPAVPVQPRASSPDRCPLALAELNARGHPRASACRGRQWSYNEGVRAPRSGPARGICRSRCAPQLVGGEGNAADVHALRALTEEVE